MQNCALFVAQMSEGGLDSFGALSNCNRFLAFNWRVGPEGGILGIELRSALAPKGVDAPVARDGEDPCSNWSALAVILPGFSPDGGEDILQDIVNPFDSTSRTLEVSLHAGSEVSKQGRERFPVSLRGDRIKQSRHAVGFAAPLIRAGSPRSPVHCTRVHRPTPSNGGGDETE